MPPALSAGVTEIVDGRVLAERARRAESLGHEALVIQDHLLEQPAPIPGQLDPIVERLAGS